MADFRTNRERERQLERQNAMRLESMFDQMAQGDVSLLNIVLKTDVRGSLEALLAALDELSTDEVKVRVISSGVGPISESDVTLAESSEAVLLGFNVRADATARRKADDAKMDIRYYSVIYGLIDDVKAAMSGMLAPEHREKILGVADVRRSSSALVSLVQPLVVWWLRVLSIATSLFVSCVMIRLSLLVSCNHYVAIKMTSMKCAPVWSVALLYVATMLKQVIKSKSLKYKSSPVLSNTRTR